MKIHYTLDDHAARLPLAIRSADQAQDRFAELRNSPGAQLVELATQHLVGTGATLADELAAYFDHDETPSETDPYALAACYAQRDALEDLLRDVRELQPGLVALHEVAELFPIDFHLDVQFMLALTVVGGPAFGYVRTYKDSEGEEYHGMVVNLAHARAHVIQMHGEFSRDLLVRAIRHGFFNHEGFLLAYVEYADAAGCDRDRLVDRLKHGLLSRGIAWYLSYRHDLAYYDDVWALDEAQLAEHVARCNGLLGRGKSRRGQDDWPQPWESYEPHQTCIDVVGYYAVRALVEAHGENALRRMIVEGPDAFIALYNTLGKPPLKTGK